MISLNKNLKQNKCLYEFQWFKLRKNMLYSCKITKKIFYTHLILIRNIYKNSTSSYVIIHKIIANITIKSSKLIWRLWYNQMIFKYNFNNFIQREFHYKIYIYIYI
jgi:hypothetical protein